MDDNEIRQLAEAIAPLMAQALLAASPSEWKGVDWAQIDLQIPDNRRHQTSQLAPLLHFILKAIAHKSYDDSIAQVLQTAAEVYVGKTLEKHLADFAAIAASKGITVEQALQMAYAGTLLARPKRSRNKKEG